jgi:hypothetical protein
MRDSARRALTLDPSLTNAHSVLGLAAVLDYDWQEAGNQFRLASPVIQFRRPRDCSTPTSTSVRSAAWTKPHRRSSRRSRTTR